MLIHKRAALAFTIAVSIIGLQPAAAQVAPNEGSTFTEMQAQAPSSEERLRVRVGKSLVINSPDPLVRVSVTDADVASAIIISEQQVLIHGQKPGSVTLLLWNADEQARSFDLQVELDVPGLRELMQRVLQGEQINVRQTGAALVLTGEVSSETVSKQAEALGKTQTSQVVNMLSIGERNEVVMLQVKMAEVDRSALREAGFNLFSTGAANTIGTIGTGQFSSVSPQTQGGGGEVGSLRLNDLLNVFIFRPDIDLGFTLRALEQKSLLQILAEPNVMALNGREASFLAGGEFPFPVVQGGSSFTAVTIEFREFGIRLNFTPELLEGDRIRLKVSPEVSALDFANALTVSGFLVPAISTRRAETEVELDLGQSFAIAGLIDNRLVDIGSKVPVLGDIPFLGNLFKSSSKEQQNSELMVMVTPQLVQPLDPSQLPPGPAFPVEFMDTQNFDKRFDGKKGETAPRQP